VSHRRDARIDAQRCRRYKSNKNKSENTNGEKLVQAQVQAVPRLESASSVAVCPQPAKEVKVRAGVRDRVDVGVAISVNDLTLTFNQNSLGELELARELLSDWANCSLFFGAKR